jgi:hypothetical protein
LKEAHTCSVTVDRVGLPDWAGEGLRRAGELLPELNGELLLLPGTELDDGTVSLGALVPRPETPGDGQYQFSRVEPFERSLVSVGSAFLLFSCSKGFLVQRSGRLMACRSMGLDGDRPGPGEKGKKLGQDQDQDHLLP